MMFGVGMKVELYHASKYGNGVKVAEEFKRLMTVKGNEVNVHHIKDVSVKALPSADLYIFGSPTHFGKATGGMVRFLKKITLPSGTRYAVFATFSAARPDKKTGKMPSEEELEKLRRTIPMIDEQLHAKGMKKVAEMKFFVDPETMKGPLEKGWQESVEAFVAQILTPP
jgi:multimeric flavodoxin WrbA